MSNAASVFDLPDPLLGTNTAWSSWANDLSGTSPSDHSSWMGDETYSWNQPIRGGVEYDPLPQGIPYDPIGITLGAQQTQSGIDSWLKKTYPQLYAFGGSNSGVSANPGVVSDLGGDWAGVDKWDSTIQAASQAASIKYGVYVPVNFVKAIMRLESNGENLSANGSGAAGPMQVVGSTWGGLGFDLNDPVGNIMAGVDILAQNYLAGDPSDSSKKSWEWAAKRYIGLGAPDSNGNDANSYWRTVSQNWNQLGNVAMNSSGTTQAPANTTVFSSIWKGFDAGITQGFGYEDCPADGSFCFARDSDYAKTAYKYTSDYSTNGQLMGHAGVDVGVSYNTPLYSPGAGTVVLAGGTGYYTNHDDQGNMIDGPQIGELAIEYANGDQVILGHMSQIVPHIGDTVKAGDFVGYSGQENGPHVHVEYRRAVGKCTNGFDGTCTNSGWQAVDPRLAMQGIFSGTFGSGASATGSVGAASPGDWNTFMMNASLGLPLNGNGASVGGFHDWLTNAMGVGGTANVFGEGTVGSKDPTRWIFNKAPSTTGGTTPPG